MIHCVHNCLHIELVQLVQFICNDIEPSSGGTEIITEPPQFLTDCSVLAANTHHSLAMPLHNHSQVVVDAIKPGKRVLDRRAAVVFVCHNLTSVFPGCIFVLDQILQLALNHPVEVLDPQLQMSRFQVLHSDKHCLRLS